jgi:signal transduction histidine kinase
MQGCGGAGAFALRRAASREAKIDFVTEIAGEPMPLMVDPELLHRALSNLVLNAMDAMPNGGKLTISAIREERTSKSKWRTRARADA